jgi:DNA-binding transcriptional regulator YdaS (Cro superfamily)
MNSIKGFIKQRSALNHRKLAKLIDWSPSSFHQWLNDIRPIPEEKAKLLTSVLKEYGFKGQY